MNYPTKDTDLLDVPSTEETTHCYYKLGGTERPTGLDRPIAWLHDQPGRYDVVHEKAKALWMKAWPKQVEHYTIPLYRHTERQPLSTEAACALLKVEIGIDPMLNGNVLKMLRVIERAHGIGFNAAEITSKAVDEAVIAERERICKLLEQRAHFLGGLNSTSSFTANVLLGMCKQIRERGAK